MKTSSKKDSPRSTTKKQKFVGTQTFVDQSTGEVVPMQLIQVEDRDFNFHKVWLENLVLAVDGISNQRLRLAFWIINHLNSENQLVMTQRTIAEKSGMSLNTVTRTMKALQEGNPAFLQKINSGAYRVNPQVIWKGSYSKRMGVCFDYGTTAKKDQEQHQEAQKPAGETTAQEGKEKPLPGQIALETEDNHHEQGKDDPNP